MLKLLFTLLACFAIFYAVIFMLRDQEKVIPIYEAIRPFGEGLFEKATAGVKWVWNWVTSLGSK